MEASQTANSPSFESVWVALQEFREGMQEFREGMIELRESQKETDRITRENARLIGKLGNRFGDMIEHMVMPCLVRKFRELGFVFTEASPHTDIDDEENNIITEIDITLKNSDKVMIVEVKSKPGNDDIDEHIERMEKVRTHANLHNDNRKYLGAMAGMVTSSLSPFW